MNNYTNRWNSKKGEFEKTSKFEVFKKIAKDSIIIQAQEAETYGVSLFVGLGYGLRKESLKSGTKAAVATYVGYLGANVIYNTARHIKHFKED